MTSKWVGWMHTNLDIAHPDPRLGWLNVSPCLIPKCRASLELFSIQV
jgi:hypothetical protein